MCTHIHTASPPLIVDDVGMEETSFCEQAM